MPVYIAIDLKSFYASAECMDRGLDPLRTNLVVADPQRTEKTICLAVSPSLKAYGISGRARLFQVLEKVVDINARRLRAAPGRQFTGRSFDSDLLRNEPGLALDFITAPPRMARYMEVSAQIYNIYLNYVAAEDIHVYSIDEVFIDVTHYLAARGMTAREMASAMIRDVLKQTGITATAGVAPNLYLCKVAMDIVAKHIEPDQDGVRIAELDEERYRRELWQHTPLTDFWRVGPGIAEKLRQHGLTTMGDVARCSLDRQDLLYKLLGVNAELLIDHAWGWEPVTIADIKAYKPQTNSVSSGQVLTEPTPAAAARIICREMTDAMALDLLDKGLVTDQITLCIGYDNSGVNPDYTGDIKADRYGRNAPKPTTGSSTLPQYTASARLMNEAMLALFDRIVDDKLPIRRINISAGRLLPEQQAPKPAAEQMDLFTDYALQQEQQQLEQDALRREKKLQLATLGIKKKFGKNALLRGTSLQEGATAMERNRQIGGHKA